MARRSGGIKEGNVKKWAAASTRSEAREVFAQHTKETSDLDVLNRCKKLNELLSSDVLKGKGDSKAQLKEILGLLNAGPKRPSFLDKPPITATAGKKSGASPAAAQQASSLASPASSAGIVDPDLLLQLLEEEETGGGALASSQQPKQAAARPAQAQQQRPQPVEEVDDLISLLNDAPAPAEQRRSAKEAQEAAERKRKEEAAARAAAERKRQEEEAVRAVAERKKREEEAARAAAAATTAAAAAAAARAEALRQERLRHGAAVFIQSHYRAYCARRLAAQRRRELAERRELDAAACVLQATWRSRHVAREHRARLAAARTLQCALRAWHARQRLQLLRVVNAFVRNRAARCIQRAFRAYRARGYTLGPLRVPGRPPSQPGLDGSALLAKQLRLRGAADTRLAPEASSPSCSSAGGDSAHSHRTVVTHRERVREVSASERHRRCDMGERTSKVASQHREDAEALAIARQGGSSGGAPRPPTATPRRGASDSARPPSRCGSGGLGGAEGPGRSLAASRSGESLGLRPSSSSLRRLSGGEGPPLSPALPR